MGIESMATTLEAHAGELAGRKRTSSTVAGIFRNHRTFCAGTLYVITIIVVLAFVARF
jgi:predicted hotdog family 3-hydroxylacyl-ACP dehydratase